MADAPTTKTTYWKRTGYVAIEGDDGKMHRYGGEDGALDFRFDGTVVGDVTPSFTVGILGLSKETINELTVWHPGEAIARGRKIEVYAGYEKDGLNNPLFQGVVIDARPTQPPEMWLNFRCILNANKGVPMMKPVAFRGKKLSEMLGEIGKILGKSARWEADKEKGERKVSLILQGNPNNMVRRFAEMYGLMVFDADGVLVAVEKRGWRGEPENMQTLSVDTGMLGLGNLTVAGATVKRRLDDSARLMSWVKIESKITPKANGNYYVIKKRHVGHFRGNDWYTELTMLRKVK